MATKRAFPNSAPSRTFRVKEIAMPLFHSFLYIISISLLLLSSLTLDSPVYAASLVDIVLRLPQLSDLSTYIKGNHINVWRDVLKPLLGESKDTFSAPNLVALRIPLSISKSDMQQITDHMRDHALAREIRQLPFQSYEREDPEISTLSPHCNYDALDSEAHIRC